MLIFAAESEVHRDIPPPTTGQMCGEEWWKTEG
jgi:hypothetical protein